MTRGGRAYSGLRDRDRGLLAQASAHPFSGLKAARLGVPQSQSAQPQ